MEAKQRRGRGDRQRRLSGKGGKDVRKSGRGELEVFGFGNQAVKDDLGTAVSGFEEGKPDSRWWRKQEAVGNRNGDCFCKKLGWEKEEKRGRQVERRLFLCF